MRDDAMAGKIAKLIAGHVSLRHEEMADLHTTDSGEMRHFVTDVTPRANIPLGPDVVAPTMPIALATTASAASP